MVRCRSCGSMLPTGVDMPQELFRISEVEGGEVTCPTCHQTGTWTKTDAYFLS